MKLHVRAVPVLEDNYSYIVTNPETSQAIVVDAAEPETVDSWLRNLQLVAVLTTHHHWDHASGNRYFRTKYRVPVYGGDCRIDHITDIIPRDAEIQIQDFCVQVIHTPGHTKMSVCYCFDNGLHLFTGDTLFLGGCGKFSEGTPAQMISSLSKLSKYENAMIYPGHEYTLKNLEFGLKADPENTSLRSRYHLLLNGSQRTVPGSMREELETNPFLRILEPAIRSFTQETCPIEVMARLREMKNSY